MQQVRVSTSMWSRVGEGRTQETVSPPGPFFSKKWVQSSRSRGWEGALWLLGTLYSLFPVACPDPDVHVRSLLGKPSPTPIGANLAGHF